MGIFDFLKGQLHVLFIIVIVNVLTTVMHCQIIYKVDIVI